MQLSVQNEREGKGKCQLLRFRMRVEIKVLERELGLVKWKAQWNQVGLNEQWNTYGRTYCVNNVWNVGTQEWLVIFNYLF